MGKERKGIGGGMEKEKKKREGVLMRERE